MASVVSQGPAPASVDRSARASGARSPRRTCDDLFDPSGFDWPEPPGDDKKEAKLSHFSFRDRYEARAFYWLFYGRNAIGVVGLANYLLGNNPIIASLVIVAVLVSTVVYLKIWIRMCKRAHPVVRKREWWTSGPLNILSWHAMSQARSVIRER